jgi:hypothetical protein
MIMMTWAAFKFQELDPHHGYERWFTTSVLATIIAAVGPCQWSLFKFHTSSTCSAI